LPDKPVAAPLDKTLARPDVIARSAPLPGFMKGINLGNCLDAPAEGAWGTSISEKHFEMAAAAGFDHVRGRATIAWMLKYDLLRVSA